ncbi:MAG: histidine triad nucleotide-binding protein [Proteobacteria bacterium]|nr:histidine triad nucleotide-binding protein [Pseudomonadota bacterium]
MEAALDNCIFCKIAAKQLPANIVYEDDELMAFKDIKPAAPIHLLVIPKKHISSLSDCNASHHELLGKMLALVPKLAAEHGIAPVGDETGPFSGGYKTLINTGPEGGQEVYHLHAHLLGGPRPWTLDR